MESQLEEQKKQNDYLNMELSFMKMFMANKLGCKIEDMSYA